MSRRMGCAAAKPIASSAKRWVSQALKLSCELCSRPVLVQLVTNLGPSGGRDHKFKSCPVCQKINDLVTYLACSPRGNNVVIAIWKLYVTDSSVNPPIKSHKPFDSKAAALTAACALESHLSADSIEGDNGERIEEAEIQRHQALWRYKYDDQPQTRVADASTSVIQTLREKEYAVFVGRNNCGKSFLLRHLTRQWGNDASYLGPARYQNFQLLNYFTPTRNRKNEKHQNSINHWNQQQNVDNSPINLPQAIAELSDERRATLSEIVKVLLGIELEFRHTIPDNTMSQKYVSCGGHNISYTSSGFRLITTLVTSLLDTDYDTFLIDEPELGISPEAQGVLADFLFDRKHRQKYFPHVKTLVLATHSTIFLDRQRITNNYRIEKTGDEISIEPIATQTDFNRIHFFLLGNRFETLYLPSAILLVEGKCDRKFIDRVMALRYPNSQFSVVEANSDNRIKEVLNTAKGLLTDIQKSPYRDRIFIVLDSVHSAGLPSQIEKMGIPADNIVVWEKNGIEHFYPPSILDKVFGAGQEIVISGDDVSRNGVTYKKADLVEKVLSLLDASTPMHPHFELALLRRLESTIGVSSGSQ
jgi:predicted ATPase